MPGDLKSQIFRYATQELGFDDCRFTNIDIPYDMRRAEDWLNKSYAGEMQYLTEHLPLKKNPDKLLAEVKSAIVLTKSYKNTAQKKLTGKFKIARYAAGRDYHTVIGDKLKLFENFLAHQSPPIRCYSGVDSRPLAERDLALKSGIGFRGKNSMVIKPGLGSYFFIAVVLTDFSFPPDAPLSVNCGTCRLCIDACPTKAIKENGNLDARECISYLTIERKSSLDKNDLDRLSGWVFGCDICQEVCPYNHGQSPLTDWIDFLPEKGVGFAFFDNTHLDKEIASEIPKDSALYRSRKHISQVWQQILTRP